MKGVMGRGEKEKRRFPLSLLFLPITPRSRSTLVPIIPPSRFSRVPQSPLSPGKACGGGRSLPSNACSSENNIPFPSLANHIVLSKFWKVDHDRRVTR